MFVGRSAPEFTPVCFAEFSNLAGAPTRWIWDGYLAGGSVTLLTSRWKAGKTTLISVLLAKLQAGGELAGRRVTAGRAVVVTEESARMWAERGRRLNLGNHVRFACRPFAARPTADEWRSLIADLADLHARGGLDLAVIDPLAPFLPGRNENNAAVMLGSLTPLQRLAEVGVAVLLLHHPRKVDEEPRGSGALSGFADVLIEMTCPRGSRAADRRRRLRAASRFASTPTDVWVELSADGTDYAVVPGGPDGSFGDAWEVLRPLLEPGGLMRRELLDAWPHELPRPGLTALWRWLEQAVAEGLAERDGSGERGQPFRYWLADPPTGSAEGRPE